MFAVTSTSLATPRGPIARVQRARGPAPPRAIFTKEKPTTTATKAKTSNKVTINTKSGGKKMSQEESMKEMSGIVAQAFGVGIAFPVGIVGLLEASKNLGADSADAGLYGFIALSLGFAAWWGSKTAARDKLKAELEAKGLDMSTVDNIAVLKWVAEQDKMGKGKEAVRQIYKAYETESNPWSPFFKPVGVGKQPKK